MATIQVSDGVKLYYEDRGRGRPVLFVHGWMCSHRIWECQFYALSNDYRCIAMDLRGMGISDKPHGAYDFGTFAEDINQLITQLELKDVILVGWSMGVSVSLAYMECFGSLKHVTQLVLVNGPIKLINSSDWNFGIESDECMGYIDSIRNDPLNGRHSFSAGSLLQGTKPEIQFMYELALQTPVDVAIRAVEQQMQLDQRDVLKDIDIPCLAMGADNDFYPPELSDYIANTVQRGQCEILTDSGHCTPFQQAAKFNNVLLDFIRPG